MEESRPCESIAEALADCLDLLSLGDVAVQEKLAGYATDTQELCDLVSLAQTLACLVQLRPRYAFVEGARQQLIARLPDHSSGSEGDLVH